MGWGRMTYAENTTPINRPVKKSFKSTASAQPAICFLLSRASPLFFAWIPCWLPRPRALLLLAYHHHFLGLSGSFPKDPLSTAVFHNVFPGGVLLYLSFPKTYICVPHPGLPPFHPAGWTILLNSGFPRVGSFFFLRWIFSNSLVLATAPQSPQASCL